MMKEPKPAFLRGIKLRLIPRGNAVARAEIGIHRRRHIGRRRLWPISRRLFRRWKTADGSTGIPVGEPLLPGRNPGRTPPGAACIRTSDNESPFPFSDRRPAIDSPSATPCVCRSSRAPAEIGLLVDLPPRPSELLLAHAFESGQGAGVHHGVGSIVRNSRRPSP